MKNFLPALLLLCFFFTASAFAGDLPFTIEKGLLIVSAKIKKDKPVEVVLATGLHMSVLETTSFSKYKLQAYFTNDGPVTGVADKTMTFVAVPDIIVGDAKPTSLNLSMSSSLNVSERLGRDIFAMLGADFFKGKIVQFDFEKKVVRFLDKAPAPDAKMMTLTFDMDSAVKSPLNTDITVPVVDGILFNGKTFKTLLNTGNGAAVILSYNTTKELSLSPLPEKGKTSAGQIRSIKIKEIDLADVPGMFFGKDTGFEQRESNYDVVFGLALLKNFTATFDYKEKVVILERPL